jgi:hypothetical protein
LRVSFDYQWLESGSGQIEGSDQAIVAAANDHDFPLVVRHG